MGHHLRLCYFGQPVYHYGSKSTERATPFESCTLTEISASFLAAGMSDGPSLWSACISLWFK